jgi:hypothetical protein
MHSLWIQEITFLLILFIIIFLIYNAISFFLNRSTFKRNMKLSLKYIGIIFLIFLFIPFLLWVINKF